MALWGKTLLPTNDSPPSQMLFIHGVTLHMLSFLCPQRGSHHCRYTSLIPAAQLHVFPLYLASRSSWAVMVFQPTCPLFLFTGTIFKLAASLIVFQTLIAFTLSKLPALNVSWCLLLWKQPQCPAAFPGCRNLSAEPHCLVKHWAS